MRIAHIPPIANLDYANRSDLHLVLAQHLSDPDYAGFYRRAQMRGDHVILDNGAHEDELFDLENLFGWAEWLKPAEIVVPDIPGDGEKTGLAAHQTVTWLRGNEDAQRAYEAAGRPRLMFVPQGATLEEWARCLGEQVEAYLTWPECEPPVIGLAKHHDSRKEIPGGHVTLLRFLQDNVSIKGMDIHLLGWPDDPFTLQDVARDFPKGVRSVDSAKPFVYALADRRLDPDTEIQLLHRTSDYFHRRLTPEQEELVEFNLDAYAKFAEARA